MKGRTLSFGKRADKAEENKNSPSLPRKMKKGDTGIEKQFTDLLVRASVAAFRVAAHVAEKNRCRWAFRVTRARR